MSAKVCDKGSCWRLWTASYAASTLVAVVVLSGCNNSQFDYAKVSGQILLDGEPLSDARITFMPTASGENGEAGPYSNGKTDAEGRYQLESVATNPVAGAVVGSHRVIISTKRSHLDPDKPDTEIIDSEEIIPFPYNHYRKTTLNFEVPAGGSKSADFEIQSKNAK